MVGSAGHVTGCPHFILLSLSLKPILSTLLCLCLSLTWELSPSHQSLLLLPHRHGNLLVLRPTPILVCHYYCTIAVSRAEGYWLVAIPVLGGGVKQDMYVAEQTGGMKCDTCLSDEQLGWLCCGCWFI